MKKTPDWLKVSAPAALLPLEGGRALRLLTETEEMQVRREAMELAVNEMDLPLCANACLVARALGRWSVQVSGCMRMGVRCWTGCLRKKLKPWQSAGPRFAGRRVWGLGWERNDWTHSRPAWRRGRDSG